MHKANLDKDYKLLLPKMKIEYDPDADAMYITLKEEDVDCTKEIDPNTLMDLNKKGEVIGIELLFVKERNPDLLRHIQIENVLSA